MSLGHQTISCSPSLTLRPNSHDHVTVRPTRASDVRAGFSQSYRFQPLWRGLEPPPTRGLYTFESTVRQWSNPRGPRPRRAWRPPVRPKAATPTGHDSRRLAGGDKLPDDDVRRPLTPGIKGERSKDGGDPKTGALPRRQLGFGTVDLFARLSAAAPPATTSEAWRPRQTVAQERSLPQPLTGFLEHSPAVHEGGGRAPSYSAQRTWVALRPPLFSRPAKGVRSLDADKTLESYTA